MGRNILLLVIVVFVTSIKAQDKEVLVAYTNDTHSCVMPITPNFADTSLANKGGFLRRIVLLDSLRLLEPDMLLFDCGDFSQGSPYYNIFKGDVEVELMNKMEYNACAIGNHEFDFGLDNLARLIRKMDFPVVCCNYDFTRTPIEDLVYSCVVYERKGVRIGVLGVSPELEGLVARENYAGVEYLCPVLSANIVAKYLKLEERCDVIICLSHLGWETNNGISDRTFIENTRFIDVVLGAHTHTDFESPELLVNADGAPVVYSQMGKNGRFVGTLRLNIEPIKK